MFLKKKITLFYLFSLIPCSLLCQENIRVKEFDSFWFDSFLRSNQKRVDGTGKTITVDRFFQNGLNKEENMPVKWGKMHRSDFKLFLERKGEISDYLFPNEVSIFNLNINLPQTGRIWFKRNQFLGSLFFKNINTEIYFHQNHLTDGNVFVENSSATFSFHQNSLKKGKILSFYSNDNASLTIRTYPAGDKVEPQFSNFFQANFHVSSTKDTIAGLYLLNNNNSVNKYDFYDDLFKPTSSPNFFENKAEAETSARFQDCKFKDSTDFEFIDIDTVKFYNCEFGHSNFYFLGKKTIVLDLDHSDLSNLRFDFSSNIVLKTNLSSKDEDKYLNIFNTLIEKFKREGKLRSEENVSIQLKKYKYSMVGYAGQFVNWLDMYWWNYGYSKQRIIYITIVAVLFFFVLNLIFSRRMLEFYPIFSLRINQKQRFLEKIMNRGVLMFVYTIYVFFGLNVDFEKIQHDKTWFVIYFFIQYFFGLICLLFLFGAILKF